MLVSSRSGFGDMMKSMGMIKYGRQNISKDDIDAVVRALQSEMLTQGPLTVKFENQFAEFVNSHNAIAVNSATSALHLAYLALGLSSGDLLWTSPNTFVATTNAAIMCGANIDFVDVDPEDGNLCVETLENKLQLAQKLNKLPKIVVPVHFSGLPCKMHRIFELGKKFGFRIVEDASHAAGARYADNKDASLVGNCEYSDATVFSFHPVKILTTGEGGMITTNNNNIARQIRLLRSHGVTRDASEMQIKKQGEWEYDQIALGYNYRMTDIQASLGISQLARLDSFLEKRKKIAELYNFRLKFNKSIFIPDLTKYHYSAWHLYVVQIPSQNRKKIYNNLVSSNIGVNVHYKPVHTNSYYKNIGFKLGDFPRSESLYDTMITLPIHTKLEVNDVNYVCDKLLDAVNN